jgi:dihydropyrimidinase
VAAARSRGLPVFAECLCGHLVVDESVYFQDDPAMAARYVMSPPFRGREHREALWNGLFEGSVQTTASDNCTFTTAQRATGLGDFTTIPSGAPGLEDRMRIVWDGGVAAGRMTPGQFVGVTSANTAKLFNIYPRKGCIRPGSDADIVLWDPEASHTVSATTHHHAIDYTVFEGMTFQGSPQATILAGNVVMEDGEVLAEPGTGRHVARPTFGPLYDMLGRRNPAR